MIKRSTVTDTREQASDYRMCTKIEYRVIENSLLFNHSRSFSNLCFSIWRRQVSLRTTKNRFVKLSFVVSISPLYYVKFGFISHPSPHPKRIVNPHGFFFRCGFITFSFVSIPLDGRKPTYKSRETTLRTHGPDVFVWTDLVWISIAVGGHLLRVARPVTDGHKSRTWQI